MNSVGSSSDGNTSNNNGEHGDNDNTPLWKYVKKLEKNGKAGGNTSFQCNYCQKTFKGSYFRVKSHLLKLKGNGVASCTKVTNSHLMEMEKVVEEAELRVKMAQLRDVPLPTSNTSSQGGSSSGLAMSSNWKRPEYKEGVTHMWDVGGDAFDSMDLENAGVLEIANLSLDEPDLEGIIFTHDE
ncbi:hypothetical protein L3X38_031550 [Prunus dulcis]|uniref:BED-type domain-containing protein n=1 Tax=Prunus dulcis TaxID=3755 RepID=A0AAD4YVR4_PRUDU|nr:hypothetical protein L3X38_031550 [Prunus dulcis]